MNLLLVDDEAITLKTLKIVVPWNDLGIHEVFTACNIIEAKEILKTQGKFYLADPALRYSVLGYSPDSVAAMLENVIYLELLRRGYDVYVGKLDNAEIDFIAVKQENKVYIQAAQKIGSPETERREYGRLLDIRDNYPKYVLQTDAFAGGNYEGIKTMHIADFLLSDEY